MTTGTSASRAKSQVATKSPWTPSTALTTRTRRRPRRGPLDFAVKIDEPGVSARSTCPRRSRPAPSRCRGHLIFAFFGSVAPSGRAASTSSSLQTTVATTSASSNDVLPTPFRPMSATSGLGWLGAMSKAPRFTCAADHNVALSRERCPARGAKVVTRYDASATEPAR